MNRRIHRVVHCASLLLLAITSRSGVAEDAFQPMFNGTDLSGWVLTNTPPQTWSFQDGMLVCSGRPIGEIRTEKMYQNFVMELEWRHMVPRGNAGVFIWADDITARGVPFHRGIEVQILENAYGDSKSHTTHGDIFPIHGATMTPENGRGGNRAFPREYRSHPSPEWNHYRIECRDGEISLAVNGEVVTRGKDCVPRNGYICLESEGGVVHYRNVKIQELPSTEIKPAHVAIANRGYRSLYTGLNLDGWNLPPGDTRWKVSDWVLTYNGGDDEMSRLSSTETFENLGCVVDVRLKAASSNAVIHVGSERSIDLSNPLYSKHLQAVGNWNRIEGSVVDGVYSWIINGQRIPAADAGNASGKSSLAIEATGPVELCNLYGRSVE